MIKHKLRLSNDEHTFVNTYLKDYVYDFRTVSNDSKVVTFKCTVNQVGIIENTLLEFTRLNDKHNGDKYLMQPFCESLTL